MNVFRAAVLMLCLVAATEDAFGQRVPLDDSLSPQRYYALDMNWGPADVGQAIAALLADQDAALPPLRGFLAGVEVRLDTRRFLGERVRVFMSVPGPIVGDESAGTLQLEWHARGAFESGSLLPGQPALIFEGRLDRPVLAGTFDFAVTMSSIGAADTFDFELDYELEIID